MSQVSDTLKTVVKLLVKSRPAAIKPVALPGERLVIMGNGPSLRDAIDYHRDALTAPNASMAVNFAANTPQFFDIKPRYYTIADPHFFRSTSDPNVSRLLDNLGRVDWPMTLFVPMEADAIARLLSNASVTVVKYNALGLEGSPAVTHPAFDRRRGMPRPRNVLIPSIMIGAWLGYKTILLAGADHSWTANLSVAPDNRVITNLPHFYTEDAREQERIKAVYADIPLHALFLSYHIAFKAYHEIARWASSRGITILNATPGSFIDAFPRTTL